MPHSKCPHGKAVAECPHPDCRTESAGMFCPVQYYELKAPVEKRNCTLIGPGHEYCGHKYCRCSEKKPENNTERRYCRCACDKCKEQDCGRGLCEHLNNKGDRYQRHHCPTCNAKNWCSEHNDPPRLKERCVQCKGKALCKHGVGQRTCVNCQREGEMASGLCPHNKRISRCKECRVSKKGWCTGCDEIVIDGYSKDRREKYGTLCARCFKRANPNVPRRRPIQRNFRRLGPEPLLFKLFGDTFAQDFFRHNVVPPRKPGVPRARTFIPDFTFYPPGWHVIVECDERQHEHLDEKEEWDRVAALQQEFNTPLVVIRFNPDYYTSNGTNMPGCFDAGGNLVNEHEWFRRTFILMQHINNMCHTMPGQPLTEIKLFYNE